MRLGREFLLNLGEGAAAASCGSPASLEEAVRGNTRIEKAAAGELP
ncbi:MAG: hypothetical protein U1F77_13570 [Kiritimatiellia bacterium]